MKANELRIGNFVLLNTWDTEWKPHRIDEILEKDKFNDVQPIPITPDILGKAGITKMRHGLYKIGYDFTITFLKDVEGNYVVTVFYKSEHLLHIKYLHQLQNLYFALTGTELNINL